MCPWTNVLRYSLFMPASLNMLLMSMDVYSNLLLVALFFQASGGAMAEDTDPKCSPADVWEQIGQTVAVGIVSAIFAVVPGLAVSSFHTRDFLTFEREEGVEWRRQLRVWRRRDRVIWCIGGAWYICCIFFTVVFLANVTEADALTFFIATVVSFAQSHIAIPVLLSLLYVIIFFACKMASEVQDEVNHTLHTIQEKTEHGLVVEAVKMAKRIPVSKWSSPHFRSQRRDAEPEFKPGEVSSI